MYDVTEYTFQSVRRRTRFWWTAGVMKAIGNRDRDERHRLMKRIERYAKDGFWNHEGIAIRHEKDGVWRIGSERDLFRIIGFYENNERNSFIAIDAFLKKGQRLTEPQKRRVDEVARVRNTGDWRKKGAP